MFRAVHADRAGRVIVSATTRPPFRRHRDGPLAQALPLPAGTDVVHLSGRGGNGSTDRRARELGPGRLAVAAVLPPGYLRTQLPAYADDPDKPDLSPRGYAALGRTRGDLVVAVSHSSPAPERTTCRAEPDRRRGQRALRERPAGRLVRQLARCATRVLVPRGRERVLPTLGVRASRRRRRRTSIRRQRSRRASTAKPTSPRARGIPRDRGGDRRRVAIEHVASGGTLLVVRAGLRGRAAARRSPARGRDATHPRRNALRHDPPRDERLVAGGAAPTRDDRARRGHDPSRLRARGHVRDAAPAARATASPTFAHRSASPPSSGSRRACSSRSLPGVFDRTEEIEALVSLRASCPREAPC